MFLCRHTSVLVCSVAQLGRSHVAGTGGLHADTIVWQLSDDNHSSRLRENGFAKISIERDRRPGYLDAALARVLMPEDLKYLINTRQHWAVLKLRPNYLVCREKALISKIVLCRL